MSASNKVALIALVGALTVPSAAAAAPARHRAAPTLRGTVVNVNRRAHSFTIATAKGVMRSIHARRLPPLGDVVVVGVRRLRNGTFALKSLRVVGKGRRRVHVRGVVSYVNPRKRLFVISGEGVSLAVRERPAVRIAGATLPTVGTREAVSGELTAEGTVVAEKSEAQGQTSGPFDLEGVVLGLEPAARTITVSAEADDRIAATVTVTVPAQLPFPTYAVGEEVELQVTDLSGILTLTGASSDQGQSGAEDQEKAEGETTDAADHEDAQEEGDNEDGGDGQRSGVDD